MTTDRYGMERGLAPYLLQVIEHHSYDRPMRWTVEQAREAWEKKEELSEHSGLPKKVAQFCDDLMSWHYMGNAEYEWGAIPSAIVKLFDEELTVRTLVIPAKDLPRNGWGRSEPARKGKKKQALPEAQDLTMYYLGPKDYVPELPAMMKLLCQEKLRTKAGTFFSYMADPISEYDKRYHGWLCLDFPFWMTKDRTVWETLCRLYKVVP